METKPAEVRHPGAYLRDEMETRRWSVMELARKTNLISPAIIFIIREIGYITDDIAMKFAEAFGTSIDYWLNLQRAWDEFQERSKG